MCHEICNNVCKHVVMETTVIDIHGNKVLLEFSKAQYIFPGNYVKIYQIV